MSNANTTKVKIWYPQGKLEMDRSPMFYQVVLQPGEVEIASTQHYRELMTVRLERLLAAWMADEQMSLAETLQMADGYLMEAGIYEPGMQLDPEQIAEATADAKNLPEEIGMSWGQRSTWATAVVESPKMNDALEQIADQLQYPLQPVTDQTSEEPYMLTEWLTELTA